METLVQANPQNPSAYLALAQYERQQNRLDKAERAIQQALGLDSIRPEQRAELLGAAAELAQARGDLDKARRLAEDGLKANPASVGLYRVLAGLDMRAGRRADAIACLRRGLQK